jgi:partner of Y14 and mago protein
LSKSAKKNAKRKEKKTQELAEGGKAGPVPDNWDDDEEETPAATSKTAEPTAAKSEGKASTSVPTPKGTTETNDSTKSLVDKLEKLNVESQE